MSTFKLSAKKLIFYSGICFLSFFLIIPASNASEEIIIKPGCGYRKIKSNPAFSLVYIYWYYEYAVTAVPIKRQEGGKEALKKKK